MNLPVKTRSPHLVDTSTIPGWGVDADPENDPTWPIRDQSHDQGLTRQWDRPPVQQPDVEILQSIEHIRQPAVVGTSTPPSGVSGMVRRLAFRWSESNWLHWLMLLGADRINVVAGVVEDLAHARVPNIPAEMGIRSELQFNKGGFAKNGGSDGRCRCADRGFDRLATGQAKGRDAMNRGTMARSVARIARQPS